MSCACMHVVWTVIMYSTHLTEWCEHVPHLWTYMKEYHYAQLCHFGCHIVIQVCEYTSPLDCTQYGYTALHWASWNGYAETVTLLLQKQANASICDEVCVLMEVLHSFL